MSEAHSPYGPSSLERVIFCPGSIRVVAELIEKGIIPAEEESSPAALRGTACHEATADILMNDNNRQKYEELSEEERGWVDFNVTASRGLIDSLGYDVIQGVPLVGIEQKVDPGPHAKDLPAIINMFGTLDLGAYSIAKRHLIIADHKFGGWDVAAKDCRQLKAYAFMAVHSWLAGLKLYMSVPEPEKITLVIIQPRVGEKIKKWNITLPELNDWWHTEVVYYLRSSVAANPPMIPSEKACKWCRADGRCLAQDKTFTHAAKQPASAEDRERLNKLGLLLPAIKSWVKKVDQLVTECAGDETGLKDLKPVLGRAGDRFWADEDKADKFLARQGLKKNERAINKLITPAVAAKELKKKEISKKAWTAFNGLVDNEPAKPTYAPLDDPRPDIRNTTKEAEEALNASQDANKTDTAGTADTTDNTVVDTKPLL